MSGVRKLMKWFLEEELFKECPEWRDHVSLLITGSVAEGAYDRYSDIDLSFFVTDGRHKSDFLPKLKAFKKVLWAREEPLQLHNFLTFDDLEEKLVRNLDTAWREHSCAVILWDPHGKYREMRRKYRYFPREVWREKIVWLFAEAVFSFRERMLIAIKRRDYYYVETQKINVIRLLLNSILLANRKFPAFDKHLFERVATLESCPSQILSQAKSLLKERNLPEVERGTEKFISLVEKYLLAKKLIRAESMVYWIRLRPKHEVNFSDI
jgi:hypothetical protein